MGNVETDLVQRYFDGELEDGERARFEAAMTDEDRERLAALAEMRALVAGALDAAAAEVDIWPAVARQLAQPEDRDEGKARGGQHKKLALRGWRDRVRNRLAGAGVLAAALATVLLLFLPWRSWHPRHPENRCDVENLEFHGSYATVLQVHDLPHRGDDATTIIWSEED